MRLGRTLLFAGFVALTAAGTKLAFECSRSPRNIQTSSLPTSPDGSSVRPKLAPPINIREINSILSVFVDPEAMRIRQMQLETGKEEKDIHSVDSINAAKILRDDEGALCSEIHADGKLLGYLRPMFPDLFIEQIAQGKPGPYTLCDIFSHPIENLYFDITDFKTGMVLGKTVSDYAPQGKGMIDRLVWNDGTEELFVQRDNLMFRADNAGGIIDQNPVWRSEITSQEDLRLEEWKLISDESIKVTIGGHMDAYRVLARLQSECSEGAAFLPEFIEVTPENFAQFVQKSFLESGK